VRTLTPRQQQIYDWIAAFMREHGYAPSVREMQQAFEFRSPNSVIAHLVLLERKGAIRRPRKSARAIELLLTRTPVSEGVRKCQELFGQQGLFVKQVCGDRLKHHNILDGDYVVLSLNGLGTDKFLATLGVESYLTSLKDRTSRAFTHGAIVGVIRSCNAKRT
jgi:SOS-response transcriptional repressor LexA